MAQQSATQDLGLRSPRYNTSVSPGFVSGTDPVTGLAETDQTTRAVASGSQSPPTAPAQSTTNLNNVFASNFDVPSASNSTASTLGSAAGLAAPFIGSSFGRGFGNALDQGQSVTDAAASGGKAVVNAIQHPLDSAFTPNSGMPVVSSLPQPPTPNPFEDGTAQLPAGANATSVQAPGFETGPATSQGASSVQAPGFEDAGAVGGTQVAAASGAPASEATQVGTDVAEEGTQELAETSTDGALSGGSLGGAAGSGIVSSLVTLAQTGNVGAALKEGGATFAGAEAGAAVGTLIAPGIGTAIGGVIGGIVGGIAGGRVICTELVRQGLMSQELLDLDKAFSPRLPRRVIHGYGVWAPAMVRLMQRSKLATAIIRPIAVWRAHEIAHIMNARPTCHWRGRLVRWIGEAFCYAVSVVADMLERPVLANGGRRG